MKNILLYKILGCTAHGKTWKKSFKNNRLKISAPACKSIFGIPNASYSASNIKYYFEYILRRKGKRLIILQ